MNTPFNPTPSLLTLTAPPAERAPDEAATAGFAEQLSAAAGTPDEQRREAGESAADPREDKSPAPDSVEQQTTQENESSETPTESAEETPEAQPIENPLLAVTLVSETIVAETSPHADLPEHAATTLNVGLAVEGAASSEAGSEAPPSLENIEVFTDAEGSSEGNGGASESATEPLIETGTPSEETTNENSERSNEAKAAGSPFVGEARSAEASPGNGPLETASTPLSKGDASTESPEANPQPTSEGLQSDPAAENKPLAPNTANEAAGVEAPASNESSSTREAAPPAASPTVEAVSERRDAERAGAAESRPTVDPARFVSRVSRAIEAANERGGGPIEIRLSPPELGSLRVQIEMKEGLLSASLETETPAARNTLLDNLPALRERLEQQQIRLEKFNVDVRDDSQQRGGGGAPEGETQRRPDDSPDRREPSAERRPEREADTEEPSQRIATITFDDDGLNLVA